MDANSKNESKIKTHLSSLTGLQKKNILDWAIEVRKIQQNKSLTAKQKLYDFKKLNNKDTFTNVISVAKNYSKDYWSKSSWAQRIGIIGLSGGIMVGGLSGGAGIAALGGAIGLPFFLLTSAGGVFVGFIIDSLKGNNSK